MQHSPRSWLWVRLRGLKGPWFAAVVGTVGRWELERGKTWWLDAKALESRFLILES